MEFAWDTGGRAFGRILGEQGSFGSLEVQGLVGLSEVWCLVGLLEEQGLIGSQEG